MSHPGPLGLIITTMIANIPQVLLSFLYLTYNSLFTCMWLAQEWDQYSRRRRPLRVTTPQGIQRSTYRLQLPYHYSVPLLITSGILHWLASQSLFLARVDSFDQNDEIDPAQSVSTCGYSPIAMITLVMFGSTICLLEIANGFRKLKTGMPTAGSCSAAISAACHPPDYDQDAALKPVMWGVVGKGTFEGKKREEEFGHCAFSSFPVEELVEGRWYAGKPPPPQAS